MIDLYAWPTPNGRKISIALEEMALPYRILPIDIGKNEQFTEDFLKISPNNKIPAIVDQSTGLSLFESGAILLYLAEKSGRFLPLKAPQRWKVMEWLMWQVASFGPAIGQAHHFLATTPRHSPYAEERFQKEALRLLTVLERHLATHPFLADAFSIADMALWPWICGIDRLRCDLGPFRNIARWYLEIAQRPGVNAGYRALKPQEIPMPFHSSPLS